MKKRFQGIVDFNNEKICSKIKTKINEDIIINLILRLSKDAINLSNHRVNLFVVSKSDKNNAYYSNSMVKIISNERGLIQCEIPGFTFEKGGYIGVIEVLSLEEGNFISSTCLEFEVDTAISSRSVEILAPQDKIETLQQLDIYIQNALEALEKLKERMEGK